MTIAEAIERLSCLLTRPDWKANGPEEWRPPEVVQRMMPIDELRETVHALGARLRVAGVAPEKLVPALRSALDLQATDGGDAYLPPELSRRAVSWGIEGYYDLGGAPPP